MKKCFCFFLCIFMLCGMSVTLSGCGFSAATQTLCDHWLNEPEAMISTKPPQGAPDPTPPSTTQTPSTEPVNPPATVNIAGDYTLYSMQMDGMTLDKDMLDQALKSYGTDSEGILQMELRADGTGLVQIFDPESQEDLEAELGWNTSHLWPQEDPTYRLAYTYSNNQLTLTADGVTVVLQKTVLSL